MQYRMMENLGVKVSAFGMGLMRLARAESGAIDRQQAARVIYEAADRGVNYYDTAYVYQDGDSERCFGEVLKGRPGLRDKILLTSKLPFWCAKSYDDYERILDESLARMGTDHIDFYLLHSLDLKRMQEHLDALAFLDKMKAKGKIRFACCSVHDEVDGFKAIADLYNWDMMQVQFNVLDTYHQASLEGVRYAGSKGINIVVMEPLRGGALARNVPDPVKRLYLDYPVKRSPADWAFRYVCDRPEVKVVLSGISTLEELEQNLATFETALPGSLSADELALLDRVRETYESLVKIGCTGCGYCVKGCPQDVAIPDIFRSYDNACMFDTLDRFKQRYAKLCADGKGAGKCVRCGQCENVCPQHFPIIELLADIHARYGI